MKKLILILSLALLSVGAAEAARNVLKISSNGKKKIVVFIDGVRANARPANQVSLSNLYPGKHRAKVVIFGRYGKQVVNTRVFVKGGYVNNYALAGGHRGLRLQKTSTFPVYRSHRKKYELKKHYSLMDDRKFDRLMHELENARFDSDKMFIVRSALKYNSVTSSDVLLIMETLTYESSRLELAKFAFFATRDKQNYHVVSDGLRFVNSRRELNRFLLMNA